ncbi:unnamed protein product [Acanthoscelides obtectus]|uniref:Uncharacterized protein n=1 Tax=Acanthoscelides obtectus TaxID=200917 RepID=A0A9P0Q836_ACAOB|nr:unnamed protein product [Acanthoscelides obtectus]CAK1674841.1 hypothetical protein AOBTE_LOCUS29769 [Acanthoscelides obtectus]
MHSKISAKLLPDGSYNYCCGTGGQVHDEHFAGLDPGFQIILKRLDKVDASLSAIKSDIQSSSNKLTELEEIVTGESLYDEMKDRMNRENFIIYNFDDSVNAAATDSVNIKNCSRIQSFSDLTKKQQAHMQKLKNEVKDRSDKGEKDLKIKHIRGKPDYVLLMNMTL